MFNEVKKIIDSVDGWLSEREAWFLYETAKKTSKDGVIVEIGSWQGKSTICLAKGSQEGNKVPVYAIDPHIGSSEHQKDGQKVWTFEKFKENIKRAGVEDMVFPIVKTSEDAIKGWDKPISFLWIDGAHEYEFVKKDFELWSPFLIDGGIVAFHDVVSTFSGPRKNIFKEILLSKKFSKFNVIKSIFSARSNSSKLNLFINYLRAPYFFVHILFASLQISLYKKFLDKIFEKLSWRLGYIKRYPNIVFSLLLPGYVRNVFLRPYPLLRWFSRREKSFSLKASSEDSNYYLISFNNDKFIIPQKGFFEGDFFDIYYKDISVKNVVENTIFSDGPYEYKNVFLREGDFVVDAGSNIGLFSIYASKKVGPKGKVFSFEPVPSVGDFVRKNVSLNKVANVDVFNCALSSKKGEEFFYVDLEESFEGTSSVFKRKNSKIQKLQQDTIDNLFYNQNRRVDFIKADIEGAEREMLLGAERTIKEYKPRISIRTYHLPDDPYVIESILKDFVPDYTIIRGEKTLYAICS